MPAFETFVEDAILTGNFAAAIILPEQLFAYLTGKEGIWYGLCEAGRDGRNEDSQEHRGADEGGNGTPIAACLDRSAADHAEVRKKNTQKHKE